MPILRIISDLHLEFNPSYKLEKVDNEESSYLILAGDICVWDSFQEEEKSFFDDCSKRFKKIYYIPGNHEYFHRRMHNIDNEMKQFFSENYDNIEFLNNEVRVIEDTKFIFSTLWSDASNPNAMVLKNQMSDYRAIKRITPAVTTHLHNESVNYIINELELEDYEKKIVVTHHLPSFKSVHPKYHRSPIGMFFYSDLDHIIEKYSPKMWIHGHSHASADYLLFNTNVVSNPRDYGITSQADYNPFLVKRF